MRVGLIQSNYIPWKGYFDIINDVDVFIFHDSLQYTKGDWRNRNRIKTPAGPQWLTIPVGTDEHRLIEEVPLPADDWALRHWRRLEAYYGRAPYFRQWAPFLRDLYFGRRWERLSEFNQAVTIAICRELGMTTAFANASDYPLTKAKSARVLEMMQLAGATQYVTGPAARDYMDESAFQQAGIEVVWWSYAGYPVYRQAHPPFAHDVTILDLLFNEGPDAAYYIWGWRQDAALRRAS
ncbi:MAG: WbqC family protein [Vicinamibacterales bacterium]